MADGSILDLFRRSGPGTQEAPKDNADTAKLMAEIAALNTRLEQQERTNQALLTQRTVEVPDNGPGDYPVLDLSNLPDPSMETEQYNKELGKRVSDHSAQVASWTRAQIVAETSVASDAQRRADSLYDRFQEKYPDFDGSEKALKFIVNEMVEEAEGRGHDIRKYAQVNPDGFLDDVMKQYTSNFAPKGKAQETAAEAEDAGRTEGVFGGFVHGAELKPGDNGKGTGPTLAQDFLEIQKAMGIL